MVNTRLVMALEELFKKEPFDLEIIEITINASRGTITVEEYGIDEIVNELECEISDLEEEKSSAEMENEFLERKISDLKELLDENDIDY